MMNIKETRERLLQRIDPVNFRGSQRFWQGVGIVTLTLGLAIGANVVVAGWDQQMFQNTQSHYPAAEVTPTPPAKRELPSGAIEQKPVIRSEDLLKSYLDMIKPEGLTDEYNIGVLPEPVQIVGQEGGSRVRLTSSPYEVNEADTQEVELKQGETFGEIDLPGGKKLKPWVQSVSLEIFDSSSGQRRKVLLLIGGYDAPGFPGGQKPVLAEIYGTGDSGKEWKTDLNNEGTIYPAERFFPKPQQDWNGQIV